MSRIPSYSQGYARSPWESDYPELWRGLVGAWVPALGPTGAVLWDVLGKNPCAVNTGVSWRPDRLVFGGTGGVVAADRASLDPFTTQISWVIGFNPTTTTQCSGLLNKRDNARAANSWSIGFNYTAADNVVFAQIGPTDGSTMPLPIDYRWDFTGYAGVQCDCVFTLDTQTAANRKMSLHRNGTLVLPATVAGNTAFQPLHNSTSALWIGRVNTADALYFNGTISHVMIYNRTLAPHEARVLSADPLCWLRPRRRAYYSVPLASAGAVFAYYRHLLGRSAS